MPALKCFGRPCQGNSRSYRPQPSVFLLAFKAAVCLPSNASNPSASIAKATLRATGPSHLLLRAFKLAVCPPSNASASLAKVTLPAAGPSHLFLRAFMPPFARPQMLPHALPKQLSQPSVFKGVQACRLPAFKCFRRPQPFVFLFAFKPAVCLASNASNPSTSVAKATLRATGPSHLFLKSLKPAVCPPSNASAALAKAAFPATGPSHLFLMCSSLPLARPPTSASNPSAGLAKATLPAIVPSHLFLRAFKPVVCPPSNASASLAKATLPATGPSHLFLRAFKAAVARLQMLPQTLPR